MKIARVVGNVVSTVKEKTHYGKKFLIVEYMDQNGQAQGARQIAFDAVDAGIGDVVLVDIDGGAAKMLLNDKEDISNVTICGVLDHYTFDGVKH
ncbi:MAG: EutN/CcmL family microcompartment protein [Eubacteriales bacterium]|nr:EutN/CcmL family microcompartment protein [Eubacteriales bacterium]